ncbi:hypothetical protein DL96DRAFT_1704011 [Flagelloscypha sp. PMI_526]|nr:hypothetical protein DL96DRAFT_1704011 [Flagelloscypha sp. PMI_526]
MLSMISPQRKEAPHFSATDTVALSRFIDLFDAECRNANVTDDKEKLKHVVRYTDYNIEHEWRAMESYSAEPADWKAFVDELYRNYPEAVRDTRGAKERIKRLAFKYHGLTGTSRSQVAAYIREFKADWKAVKDVMSNQEGVEKFLTCLSNRYVDEIYRRLSMMREVERVSKPTKTRTQESGFTLEEVMSKALEIADDNEDGFGNLFHHSHHNEKNKESPRESAPRVVKEEPKNVKVFNDMEDLHQHVSALRDMVGTLQRQQEQQGKLFKEEIRSQFEQMRGSFGQSPSVKPNRNGFSSYPTSNSMCFYCDQSGHMIKECPSRKTDLDAGIIKFGGDGKIVMGDGSPVPFGRPIKDAVRKKAAASQAAMLSEFVFEGDEPQYHQFMHSNSILPIPQKDRVDLLSEQMGHMASMMNSLLNTRRKDYDDTTQQEN